MGKIVTIEIRDIRGGLAKSVFAGQANQVAAMRDLDIFGAPGIIRPNPGLVWFTHTGFGSGKGYCAYQASNGTFYVWGDDNGAPALQKIYKSSSGDFQGAYTAVATAVNAATLTMKNSPIEYKGTIYWFYNNKISKLVVSTETYTEQAFTTGYASPSNIVIFKDFMYYGQGNVLYRNDGTTESTAYTFASHFNIKSVIPFSTGGRDYLAVALDYKNGSGNSQIALYDGFSSLIDQFIDNASAGIQVVRSLGQTLISLSSDNSYGNTSNTDWQENYIRIKVWTGGPQMEERYAQFLKIGDKNSPYTINDGAAKVVNDVLLYGIDGATKAVTSLDPALFGFRLPNILTEERVVYISGSVSDQLDFQNIASIQGFLYAFFVNNTTAVRNYAYAEGTSTYSQSAMFDTLALQFDPLYKSRIKQIKFRASGLSSTRTIVVSEKADQAGSFTAVKTFNTSGQVSCRISPGEYPFIFANTQQLRFAPAADGVGSASTRPSIILPITIVAEVSDIDAS